MSTFPLTRLRRLRQTPELRGLVSETHLSISHFVYPLFIAEGISQPKPISSMPGISQWPLKLLAAEAKRIAELGIPAVLLFGIPLKKDVKGTQAYAPTGIVQRAIQVIKKAAPSLMVITDICLCEYTSHGHCGVIDAAGCVQNDPSLALLARMAVSHAKAGADMVAPSDMMDGHIFALRQALDARGYTQLPIMAYSAKYASGFYGPFREAAQSAPQFGDRKTYQMDPANIREAIREVDQDILEGADIIMVKPALAYLDVITQVRQHTDLPVAAYNVSGEYAMVKAAAAKGWIDEKRIVLEILTSMRRAGADIIISYFAPQVAAWLNEK